MNRRHVLRAIRRHRAAAAAVLAATVAIASPICDARDLRVFPQSSFAPPPRVVARRHLEAHNERFNKHAWLDARTSFDGAVLRTDVVAEGGSAMLRNRVLRRALEAEARAWQTGETRHATLSEENYSFGPPSDVGDLVRIAVAPRRRDQMLVDGAVFLTRDTDLVRVEGTLARSPSWWTRSVRVVRRYARICGVRVPVEMWSDADVRLAGHSTFSMSYVYEQVEDREVSTCEAAPAVQATSR